MTAPLPAAPVDFAAKMAEWARGVPAVEGLVLIGSRQRPPGAVLEQPDGNSDWDFHVITRDPRGFFRPDWCRELPGMTLRAYAVRTAVIGAMPKVAAVFDEADADLVIIPVKAGRVVRWAARLGWHRKPGWTRRRLQDVAEVIRPGWRFLKDTGGWTRLYQQAVDEVEDPWMSDAQVLQLGESFVCDYVWVRRKIARGEYRTAQRTLYQELMEANLRLLHELKHRRGEKTFTKARRIERIATPAELEAATMVAAPDPESLRQALEKAAETCRTLMAGLVADRWRWPALK